MLPVSFYGISLHRTHRGEEGTGRTRKSRGLPPLRRHGHCRCVPLLRAVLPRCSKGFRNATMGGIWAGGATQFGGTQLQYGQPLPPRYLGLGRPDPRHGCARPSLFRSPTAPNAAWRETDGGPLASSSFFRRSPRALSHFLARSRSRIPSHALPRRRMLAKDMANRSP